jgi:DnaK suppressor protein
MGSNDFGKIFLETQRNLIIKRINKYNDPERIKEELENGDVSHYTRYKQTVLVPALRKALRKIDTGKYGYCEKCGERIEIERLKVVPSAELCIKCIQNKADR